MPSLPQCLWAFTLSCSNESWAFPEFTEKLFCPGVSINNRWGASYGTWAIVNLLWNLNMLAKS